MPIAFPPALRDPSYIRQQWLNLGDKQFAVVPAPIFTKNSLPKSANLIGGSYGWTLEPCKSVQQAVNLRNLSTQFRAPDQTNIVNPASLLGEQYDESDGFDKVLGYSSLRLTGTSFDASGAPLANCVVKCFDTTSDLLVGSTVSDISGNWVIYPNTIGPYYFVEYKAGGTDVFGTSPNTNTAATFTPGG
jgi:hypothetical protein